MRINDLLRQQRHLADMMDSPAIRLGRELQERNRLFQPYENLLRQLRHQDALTGLSRDFNRTQQSLLDNVRQAAQLPETLSAAMTHSLESVKLAESAIVRRAELATVTKQTSERISLSATAAVRNAAATRSRIEVAASLNGFQRKFQRAMLEPLEQLRALTGEISPRRNSYAEALMAATRGRIEVAASLSGFQRQFQRAMLEPLRQTAQLRALTGDPFPVTAFFSQLHDILQAKTSLAALDITFTEEMQAWLHDGEAKTSESEREEFLAYLFGWLIEKFHQLPQGIISLEVFNTLLTIGFFLYSMWSDSQMENRLMEKLTVSASEKQIVCKMEEVRPRVPHRKRYVVAVTDHLHLRSEPSLKAPILASLLPNTLVEEIEQHESWSLVEFFDYKDRSVKRGWVYRDYLRAIQPEKG